MVPVISFGGARNRSVPFSLSYNAMKTIAVFNCTGRTTKTTLVYHLAHMFSRIGYGDSIFPGRIVDLCERRSRQQQTEKNCCVIPYGLSPLAYHLPPAPS